MPSTDTAEQPTTDWERRVVSRSLRAATARSIDRGATLIGAATRLLERSGGDAFTVQDVADEAGQSLRTLYQYFESKDDLLLAVFEEGMATYASLIRSAIADLDDPLDRLAGALLAAAAIAEHSVESVARGLTKLRLQLTSVDPDLVGRSTRPFSALVDELVRAAHAAGQLEAPDVDATSFALVSLNHALIAGTTVGNDTGVPTPDSTALIEFGLRGSGAGLPADWAAALRPRLRLSDIPLSAEQLLDGRRPDPEEP